MRIVLTGGPHSGKSTLIDALARRGMKTVPEAALLEIEAMVADHGADEARRIRRADTRAFQVAVSRRQAQLEASMGRLAGPVFFDRGMIDGLAYCHHYDFEVPAELERLASDARYDLCVVCSLVVPFTLRAATGRTSDETAARRLEQLITEAYRERAIPVVHLPLVPLPQRLERLLEIVESVTSGASPSPVS